MSDKPLTYKDAGVDIDAGSALVDRIKPAVAATRRPEVMAGLGGFGGLFALPPERYREPVLVSGTDGVGTKLILARQLQSHSTIGIDLVAMCVNDVLVQGAEPLFFLDYFACGHLDVDVAADVISGIADGCKQAGAALIGGETAEMPDMYSDGEYDLAGFCVGAVERADIIDGSSIAAGDALIGIASSGPHSNGYSLIRKVLARTGEVDIGDEPAGVRLLTPTRIYVKSCLAILSGARQEGGFKALAHITGGGLLENLPRVLPDDTAAAIDAGSWPLPPVFAWLASAGGMESREMARTFNCGIGMIAVVAAEDAASTSRALEAQGETVYDIGVVTKRADDAAAVILNGADEAWRA